jgi:hypothetical protein
MKTALQQLFRPVTYLRIKHPAKKLFDVTAPLWLALLTGVAIYMLPVQPKFTGPESLLSQIQELIQLLIGFFIAALAAIATFDEESLDRLMEGTPATLDEPDPYQGRPMETPLTRRRFLCFLYGYLSFLSLALYVVMMIVQVAAPSFGWLATTAWNPCALSICVKVQADFVSWVILQAGIGFFFYQMVTVTLLGLYYLTDRLNRDRPAQ